MDKNDLILLEDNQDVLTAETRMEEEEAKRAWSKQECACVALALAFACGLLPYLTIKATTGELSLLAASLWVLGAIVTALVILSCYAIYREHITTNRVI